MGAAKVRFFLGRVGGEPRGRGAFVWSWDYRLWYPATRTRVSTSSAVKSGQRRRHLDGRSGLGVGLVAARRSSMTAGRRD